MRAIISKKANKTLQALDQNMREKIKNAIRAIPAGDIKPLKGGYNGYYRLRAGGYRVIFKYIDAENLKVYDIGSRGDIYK